MSKKPSRRRRRQHRSPLRCLLICIFTVAALYAGAHCIFRAPSNPQTQQSQDAQQTSGSQTENVVSDPVQDHQVRKKDCYTILLSGVDNGNGGSDTNILVNFNAGEGYVYGVSIPRDTKAVFHGKSHKINAAYNTGGIDLLSSVISDQLGIPIDYTVLLDLRGFVALVDAIDGVDFNIPVNMNYDDPTQDLHIHFSKGMRHLNGKDAIKVVRFRHNNDGTGYGNEDIGRMQTQQNFLKAVAKKMLSVSTIPNIRELAEVFQNYVETDGLTVGNLVWMGNAMLSMGAENVNFSTLPGEWKSPYIYADKEAVLNLVNTYLNPYVEDRIPEDLNIPS